MGFHAGRRAATGMVLGATGLAAAGCLGGAAKTVTAVRTSTTTTTHTVVTRSTGQPSACTHAQLTGTFTAVPGSAGAGQIEYVLTLRNISGRGCRLGAAPPGVKLLDASGSPLPTRAVLAQAGNQSTPPATLEPGTAAAAAVRFSPDVAGPGDAQSGPCQPKAHALEVTATGGGTVDVPIRPPTSVCERGTLDFDLLKG